MPDTGVITLGVGVVGSMMEFLTLGLGPDAPSEAEVLMIVRDVPNTLLRM